MNREAVEQTIKALRKTIDEQDSLLYRMSETLDELDFLLQDKIFKIGQRVRYSGASRPGLMPFGATGVVLSVSSNRGIGVSFFEAFDNGHTLGGLTQNGHGRHFMSPNIATTDSENLDFLQVLDDQEK